MFFLADSQLRPLVLTAHDITQWAIRVRKTLKGCDLLICTFLSCHLLCFTMDTLIKSWPEPEVWSMHTLSESVVITQAAARKLKDTQIRKLICVRPSFSHAFVYLLCPGGVFVALCVQLLLLRWWDAGVRTAAPWDAWRQTDMQTHTHKLTSGSTDFCDEQTDWGPCEPAEPCLAEKETKHRQRHA